MKRNQSEISIVDLILIDHQYLKKRFGILRDDHANEKKKLEAARGFLNVLAKHNDAEKKTLYTDLINIDVLRARILEGTVEHEILDKKLKSLKPKLARIHHLSDELNAELKVLAKLVENHARDEEKDLLPMVNREIERTTLLNMGADFMGIRKFTPAELKERTNLFDQFADWKDTLQNSPNAFANRAESFNENYRH